jgi:hypothetical protein
MANSVTITRPISRKTSEGKREMKIFICSSMTLPHLHLFMKSNEMSKMTMNTEIRRSKQAAVAYFEVVSRNLPGRPQKNHRNLPQVTLSVDRGMNPERRKYEAGTQTTT